jgi:hypothetical protein
MESTRGIVHIFGGGTFIDVAPHLSLAARATGRTAMFLQEAFDVRKYGKLDNYEIRTHLTRQADMRSTLVTPEDVGKRLDAILADPLSKVVILSCAMVDFEGTPCIRQADGEMAKGLSTERLRSGVKNQYLYLTPTEKIIQRVRRDRKDIFLVGFKQTSGADTDDQFRQGLRLLKTSSCNLVFANDQKSRHNMVITPEQTRYYEGSNRAAALERLVEMVISRHKNSTFTRSSIVSGVPISWTAPVVPNALRTVVNHCIARGAYKPFLGSTVGHFAVKLDGTHFLTSRRKTDFNKLGEVGLVAIEAKGDHEVIAYGSKPSVGGQSQRIIFRDHPGLDCIVHFHCPLKYESRLRINRAEQWPFECGSHQCGKNTSDHLVQYDEGIWAVMLEQHGPNIVFKHDVDPQKVINFIEENWDLSGTTECSTWVDRPAPMEQVASAE